MVDQHRYILYFSIVSVSVSVSLTGCPQTTRIVWLVSVGPENEPV